jgi:hypothetical protein
MGLQRERFQSRCIPGCFVEYTFRETVLTDCATCYRDRHNCATRLSTNSTSRAEAGALGSAPRCSALTWGSSSFRWASGAGCEGRCTPPANVKGRIPLSGGFPSNSAFPVQHLLHSVLLFTNYATIRARIISRQAIPSPRAKPVRNHATTLGLFAVRHYFSSECRKRLGADAARRRFVHFDVFAAHQLWS